MKASMLPWLNETISSAVFMAFSTLSFIALAGFLHAFLHRGQGLIEALGGSGSGFLDGLGG
jgi:hypothetical protein